MIKGERMEESEGLETVKVNVRRGLEGRREMKRGKKTSSS